MIFILQVVATRHMVEVAALVMEVVDPPTMVETKKEP